MIHIPFSADDSQTGQKRVEDLDNKNMIGSPDTNSTYDVWGLCLQESPRTGLSSSLVSISNTPRNSQNPPCS